jgi:hypothetical protein
VQPHGLADLIADREHRIQRRHRLLKDHRDPVAADLPHLRRRQREQILSRVLDLPAGDLSRRRRDEAHHRQRRHALAAARLADHAERLLRQDLERHAIHRANRAGVGTELRDQVTDLEQRLGVGHARMQPTIAGLAPA